MNASAQGIEDRARTAAKASRQRSGDSEALRRNYVTPGLAGQPVATVDERTRFTPEIACKRSATMLEIMVQPGATGDIGRLTVSRDVDLDGRFDTSFTAPMPVSGICANGVVACQPGTWNACRSYRWDIAAGGAVKLTEVDLTRLAGCYCINASCGANLVMGNLPSVLKDLGGGVVGALTSVDPRIGVAEASIDGPVIRYTGAVTTACAASPGLAATTYRANPATIQPDAFVLSRTNSVFQSLAGSATGRGKVEQTRACTVEREVRVAEVSADDIIARIAGAYATLAPTPDTRLFQLGSPTDDSLRGGSCRLFDFRMTLRVGDVDRLRSVRLSRYFMDDWMQLRIDGRLVLSDPANWTGSGNPPGKCERGRTWRSAPDVDLTPYMTRGDHEIWLRIAVGGEGEAFAEIAATLDLTCRSTERVVDLCAGYAADKACRLTDERVDDIATVRGSVVTGLRALPQTRSFGSGACSLGLTRDFFLKDRRYSCISDSGVTPEPDMSRAAYIIDRSTETMLADRTRASNGSTTASTRVFGLPPRASVPACETLCKTRAPVVNTAAVPDGVIGSRQTDPTGWQTFYHACTTENVCPAGPGETIVSPCGCLDDFPEAAVMMQTVRLGGADLVCTSAPR
ncbi:hypothetical protein QLH51_13050 [Sphingomonas sp. 2R-10]|uniref:hypothetical protein n=1 Tax=Sphingomonas sp. 2R-10 TaxID=3045148 RepID=UPI000F779937|nr:hypothetical protein [Sphingomonas sp. 2R-10]MDJ0277726.1 hypothetical protein [Sphingomonas sp. 2R-10]